MPQPSPAARHLQAYVAIPSVNPMGRGDIEAGVAGERRYAEHVAAQLGRIGIDTAVVGHGERASVVGELRVAGAADTVMIASHLDTVPVDGMIIPPFDPAIRNDRLYGRGACDTKGGMAALMAALERVLSRGKLRRNVIVVGEADEEMSSLGVSDVLEHLSGTRIDWALVTEPTGLGLVTCHKGRVSMRLGAQGRACHSSQPDRGQNAVLLAARAIVALDGLHRELASRLDPRLGSPTLTVTMMQGGHAPNVVPDHASLVADRRTLPGETEASIRAEVEQALARAGLHDSVEIQALSLGKSALGTPGDHPAVRDCQRALRDAQLPDAETSAAFATDAGPFSVRGIPSVVLGPGDIADAHTANESVSLAQLDAMQAFFERLLSGQ
jgi:acetylornithine deacetylase/succinyl-diaminopimelate desuccinylase-like protein